MAIAQPDDAFATDVTHEFVPVAPADGRAAEEADARRLAERYRLEFLDMGLFRIDQELFRGIPAELMLRWWWSPTRPTCR
jgi:Type II secretion system (T2SS), protein E, N-terminal domain